jgi:hypothetical protein
MENTIENKAKFFAQYYGQNVLIGYAVVPFIINTHHLGEDYLIKHETDEDFNRVPYLELTPLSQITKEYAEHCSLLYGRNNPCDLMWVNILNGLSGREEKLTQPVVDYLRSKGYALPYMGISIEKQLEYGWIKLKES